MRECGKAQSRADIDRTERQHPWRTSRNAAPGIREGELVGRTRHCAIRLRHSRNLRYTSGVIPNVLSIAGSDPSGGAGIQADLKTFGALGCHGMAAITALTAQNTQGVAGIFTVPPAFVAAQIETLFDDIRIDAIKIGMLGAPEIVAAVAACLRERPEIPAVVDPVLAATSGHALGSAEVGAAILRDLAPHATLLTPNLGEAAALSGRAVAASLVEMEETGRALVSAGVRAVLVKGGHLDGDATDILCTADGCTPFAGRRIATRNTHGTGCTLSSAIAALLAQGAPLPEAVRRAKSWLEGALAAADGLDVGTGHGPVHHFHAFRG